MVLIIFMSVCAIWDLQRGGLFLRSCRVAGSPKCLQSWPISIYICIYMYTYIYNIYIYAHRYVHLFVYLIIYSGPA